MDNRIKTGYFAVSKAGHDCNEIYVIIEVDSEYVYLADGKLKTVDKPKKKKKKHIQIVTNMDEAICTKLSQNKLLINEDIKRAIKLYKNELKTN